MKNIKSLSIDFYLPGDYSNDYMKINRQCFYNDLSNFKKDLNNIKNREEYAKCFLLDFCKTDKLIGADQTMKSICDKYKKDKDMNKNCSIKYKTLDSEKILKNLNKKYIKCVE